MELVLSVLPSQPCSNDGLLAGVHQTPMTIPGLQNNPHPLPNPSALSYQCRSNLCILTVSRPFRIKKPSPLPSTDRSACFAKLPKTPRPRLSRLDKFNFPSQPQIYFFNYTTSQILHSALEFCCIALRPNFFGRVPDSG